MKTTGIFPQDEPLSKEFTGNAFLNLYNTLFSAKEQPLQADKSQPYPSWR